MDSMTTLMGILMAIGLSATCGFRVFMPLMTLNIATRVPDGEEMMITVAPGFEWMASDLALLVFAVATCIEIAGYYIPFIDNLLDTVATPAAVIAGTLVTATIVGGMSPFLKWTLAIIAGGGAAGVIQGATAMTRAASSVTTGGLGNPVIATVETSGAILGSLLSLVFVPAALLAFAFVVFAGFWVWRRRRRHRLEEGPLPA